MQALAATRSWPRAVPEAGQADVPTVRPATINLDAMVEQARLAPGFGG